jgi:hypothetical protein
VLDKPKNKAVAIQRPCLPRAHARNADRLATRALQIALERKAKAVAQLKKLGMELED